VIVKLTLAVLVNTTTRRKKKEEPPQPSSPRAQAPPQTLRDKLKAAREMEAETLQQRRRISLDSQREMGSLEYATRLSLLTTIY